MCRKEKGLFDVFFLDLGMEWFEMADVDCLGNFVQVMSTDSLMCTFVIVKRDPS